MYVLFKNLEILKDEGVVVVCRCAYVTHNVNKMREALQLLFFFSVDGSKKYNRRKGQQHG